MTSNHKDLDPRERARRRRERLIIAISVIVVMAITFFESRMWRLEQLIPVSSNVLIFGLINVNIILILLLIFLIVRNVVKLIFERRHGIIGSRLRTRLVVAFISLTLIPTALLFVVSVNFLSYSIENWFSMRIGDTLERTLEVAQVYYEAGSERAKFFARQISTDITKSRLYEGERTKYLTALIEQRQKNYKLGMVEVYFDNQQKSVLFKDQTKPDLAPFTLTPKIVEDIYLGREVASVQPLGTGEMISGLAPIYSTMNPPEVLGIVVVSYHIPRVIVEKIGIISRTSEQYRQLSLLKNPIKLSYIVTLFIVTLLIIFSATWFGLFLAKGITDPIQDLAAATRKIAQGDLDFRIDIVSRDEIGVLVESFNQMTGDLKASSEDLKRANLVLDERRKYMETVLRNVSAGVISVDRDGVVTTINRAAESMLAIDTERVLHRRYEEILRPEHMVLVDELLREMKAGGEGFVEKQIDLMVKDKALTLVVTATAIEDDEGNELGMVIVFEDLTQLQKAERAAAWREVARRMAHEIKNPLTPIQLSAQRLQKKYGEELGGEGSVFHECTRTIIERVDVLKNLVNEFSRYARMPVTNPSPHDLNEVVHDAVVLFQDAHKDISFNCELGQEMPVVNLDAEQIGRVMVNLLDNAVAAVTPGNGRIDIRTSCDKSKCLARVEIADNGCGVPPSYKIKMFEPYFSTKKSGAGLGLAIVSSIIGDHHGHISVRDNLPQGTVVSFELPVSEG
jgi:two-component system, NtrC family, nitrogen regulation sensor histidine kinase NtrY